MKQFIVDRHTTPNTPTLEQVPTEKIPIYENRAAVTADLANLTVGQIVATKDTGDELAQPVDVVEEGNMHAVSSNAVAESLSCSETEQKTGGVWIDGKPIYRKVITGTFTSGSSLSFAHNISNLDIVVRSSSITKGGTGAFTSDFYQSTSDYYNWYISGGNITLRRGSSYPVVPLTYILILEYTKTTD